jgi:hypothetical protein
MREDRHVFSLVPCRRRREEDLAEAPPRDEVLYALLAELAWPMDGDLLHGVTSG